MTFFSYRQRRVRCGGLACVVLHACLLVPLAAAAQDALTLDDAVRRTLQQHPQLQAFSLRFRALDSEREVASLRPAYRLGVEAGNIAGSGPYAGIDSAELTVSLSSVLELGGKRDARMDAATSRYALAEAERDARALDLVGEVTRRFVTLLALQEKLTVAEEATALAERSVALVKQRTRRGAAPEAELLRAQAALAQAQLAEAALRADWQSSGYALASLWRGNLNEAIVLQGDLFNLDTPATFEQLYQRVEQSPAIAVYASEERLRAAELALVQSRSRMDIDWSVGARRFEDSGESAVTAGVSVPLFAGRRNQGEIGAALARRDQVQLERESALLALRAQLFSAWQTYRQSADAAQSIRQTILPSLELALAQTRDAYERGRYSYADWISAQRDLLDARHAAIDAASRALVSQALIEQLTAEPLTEQTVGLPASR